MLNKIFLFFQKYRYYFYALLAITFFFIFYTLNALQNLKQKTSVTVPISPSLTPTPQLSTLVPSTEDQTKNDLIFSQGWDKLQKDYPWYKNLPIVQNYYTIVYDFDKKSFRIRLSATNFSPEQKNQIMNQALENLKKINVDLTKYTYYVLED